MFGFGKGVKMLIETIQQNAVTIDKLTREVAILNTIRQEANKKIFELELEVKRLKMRKKNIEGDDSNAKNN